MRRKKIFMKYSSVTYPRAVPQRGYTNRLLKIDLSTKSISIQEIPKEVRETYVGGRGYCLKLVYDGTSASTRYNNPENMLALAGGPFCGETGFVGTGKFIAGTISPLTNTFCDSNVGGHFFPLVKVAGFDALAVTGKSSRDVMVVIDGDTHEVSIVDAPEGEVTLFGAEHLIEEWKGDGKKTNVAFVTAGIGAKHTWFGCLDSVYYDSRRHRCRSKQAGRGGSGTVMREKGLWGILVKCNVSVANANHPADRERIRAAGQKLREVVREVDPKALRLGNQGTTSLIDMMNINDLLPIHNYQFGKDERAKNVSGLVFEREVFKQNLPDGCYPGCNLSCTKGCEGYTLKTGPFAGKRVGVDGPEYETAATATNLGIFDINYMLEYSWYCDQYSLDTISLGVTLSFLYEAYERGLLTREDTGGLTLTWGDAETALELLHQIASGKPGFPREVGHGVRYMKIWIADRAALRLGRSRESVLEELSRFAMESKGLEFSMYITKESLAQQGGYGFALKGPQHDESWLIGIDQLRKELPTFEEKADALRWFPLFRTWFNIVGLCKLPWIDVRNPQAQYTEAPSKNLPTVAYYIDLVNATLGTAKTLDDLLLDSERPYMLQKLINLRQGYGTREYDAIPLRAMAPVFMEEYRSRKDYYDAYLREVAGFALEGKSEAERLSLLQEYRKMQYKKLTDAVYCKKGYDRNGIPLDETLKRLGFNQPEFMEIVRAARSRVMSSGSSTPDPPALLTEEKCVAN
jgi:aldehyde:ferredoxin oxidoreductase